jgi:hypothetical protein
MDSRSAIISLKNQANIKGTVRKDLWGLFFILNLYYNIYKKMPRREFRQNSSLGFTKKQTRTEIGKTGTCVKTVSPVNKL